MNNISRLLLVTLLSFVSVNSYAASYNFSCTEKYSGLKAELFISGANDEKLSIRSENDAIKFKALLDEAEDSTYFYMTKMSGVFYTIVVSTDLFSKGEGTVTIEDDGEPIDSGSFYCKSI
jgi:hypothetical protein